MGITIFSDVYGTVVVARVEANGSCAGLLSIGDKITHLNSTPIETTSDVHSFMATTKPNQTLVVQTEYNAIVVRLGGEDRGKLGIGIANVNRTALFQRSMELPKHDIPDSDEAEPSPPGKLWVFVALPVFLVLIIVASHRGGLLLEWLRSLDARLQKPKPALHCLILFIASLVPRLVYNVSYLLRFGFHAANVIELWFYVDVANGNRHFLSVMNPTVYILRFFGLVSPEEIPFYATITCGIVLSSVVPVLIYLLVRETHGSRAGFLSGLIYGFLVQPLALSTVSFTQHIVQIPIALLFLILVVRVIKEGGRRRVIYFLSLFPIGALGYFVNVEIFVYFAIAYLVILVAVLRWLLRERNLDTPKSFGLMVLAIAMVAMPLHLYFDDIVSLSASLTAKEMVDTGGIEMIHSPIAKFVTALPLPLVVYLRFYGPYLVLIVFGLLVSWKSRDLMPYLLLLFGVLISLHWTRGSRILDIGIAMLAGIAISEWRRDWSLPALFVAVPLAVYTILFFPLSYLQYFFIVSLPVLLLALALFDASSGRIIALVAGVSYCVAVSTIGLVILEAPQSTQAEFEALYWLRHNSQPGERILTSLDRGHLPNAIANLDSVSDESNRRPEIAKAFFEIEELAALTLAEHNISYVMVSTDDLGIAIGTKGEPLLKVRGYITFEQDVRDSEIPLFAVFRLTYPDQELSHFREIYKVHKDGTTIRIYEVRRDLTAGIERMPPQERTTLSAIISNPNDFEVRTWIPVSIYDSNGLVRVVDSITLTMAPKEVIATAYDYAIRPREGLTLQLGTSEAKVTTDDYFTVSGFVETSKTGPYIFSYGFVDGSSYNVTQILDEGNSFFSHRIPIQSEETVPVFDRLVIRGTDLPHGNQTAKVVITEPAPAMDQATIIFRQID